MELIDAINTWIDDNIDDLDDDELEMVLDIVDTFAESSVAAATDPDALVDAAPGLFDHDATVSRAIRLVDQVFGEHFGARHQTEQTEHFGARHQNEQAEHSEPDTDDAAQEEVDAPLGGELSWLDDHTSVPTDPGFFALEAAAGDESEPVGSTVEDLTPGFFTLEPAPADDNADTAEIGHWSDQLAPGHFALDPPDDDGEDLDDPRNEPGYYSLDEDIADDVAVPADDTSVDDSFFSLDAQGATDPTPIDDEPAPALTDDQPSAAASLDVHSAGFLREVRRVTAEHEAVVIDESGEALATPSWLNADPDPADLGDGDLLGPTFLDAPPPSEPRRRRWPRVVVGVATVAALAVFWYGMVQLIASLDDDEGDDVAADDITPTVEPTASPAPTSEPTAAPVAAADIGAEPTATPEPLPPAQVAIRDGSGGVALITIDPNTDPPTVETLELVYPGDADLGPASRVRWLGRSAIGVIDADGRIHRVGRRSGDITTIWEPAAGLDRAIDVALVGDEIAVLTVDGTIRLIPDGDIATAENALVVWDAAEEEDPATGLSVVADLVPFVLASGNANMIVASADPPIVAGIWSAESQPAAANVVAARSGILLGVGQGAVARYRLGDDVDGPPVEPAWDPFESDQPGAIGYGPVGDRAAIVLGDGSIVVTTDQAAAGETVWDAEASELRAVAIASSSDHLLMLIETGTVLYLGTGAEPGSVISIWDVTDETISPAQEVALRPAQGE